MSEKYVYVFYVTKSSLVIDLKKALKYPLFPIRQSLSFPDGTKRSPTKSSLMKIIDYAQVVGDDTYVGPYIVDLMAAMRVFLAAEELMK